MSHRSVGMRSAFGNGSSGRSTSKSGPISSTTSPGSLAIGAWRSKLHGEALASVVWWCDIFRIGQGDQAPGGSVPAVSLSGRRSGRMSALPYPATDLISTRVPPAAGK